MIIEDLAAEFERVVALGATPHMLTPVNRADGGRAAYLRDRDGISIELQEPP